MREREARDRDVCWIKERKTKKARERERGTEESGGGKKEGQGGKKKYEGEKKARKIEKCEGDERGVRGARLREPESVP